MNRYINPYKLFVGAFIPNWLLECRDISQTAKLVYAKLCQFAGDSGIAFPAQDTLADGVGVAVRTVRDALKELEAFGLIETERVGLRCSNRYRFLLHPSIPANIADPERQKSADPERQKSADPKGRESREENIHTTYVATPSTKFAVPTVEELEQYFQEIGLLESPQRFLDFYESKGWVVGKSKMKSWRAAARTWKARRDESAPKAKRQLSPEEMEAIQR